MNAQRIGIALKGRRNGNGWLVSCPCPKHGKGRGDRSPSLSVSDGDDGRLLLRCFAGCDFADVLDEMKRRGLAEGGQSSSPPRMPSPRLVEASPDAAFTLPEDKPAIVIIGDDMVAAFREAGGEHSIMNAPSLQPAATRLRASIHDPLPDITGEYETFGDDERLAREHAEYFGEDYYYAVGDPP